MTPNLSVYMRQYVQMQNLRMYGTKYFDAFKTTCANTLEENTNKENASMCDTQSLDLYDMCKCTYAMKTHKENATPNLVDGSLPS